MLFTLSEPSLLKSFLGCLRCNNLDLKVSCTYCNDKCVFS